MFDKNELLRGIQDKEIIQGIYAKARVAVPSFPARGCAATCSHFLREAGLDVPVLVNAEALAKSLNQIGWQQVGRDENPEPGDVFVTIDKDGNRMADHIGVVAAALNDGRFLCVDNHLEDRNYQAYRRNIYGDGYTPVDYWLRWVG